jgi:hypothetical protein
LWNITPDGSAPDSVNVVAAGAVVTVRCLRCPAAKPEWLALVITGGLFTVSVNVRVVTAATPLFAFDSDGVRERADHLQLHLQALRDAHDTGLGAGTVHGHGGSTLSVKTWLAAGATPLFAFRVKAQPPESVGVPDSVAVPLPLSWKVMPDGSEPDLVTAGGVG